MSFDGEQRVQFEFETFSLTKETFKDVFSAQRAARQIFQSIETRDPSTEALRDKSEGQNINLRTSS